ncbi:hypothetical protein ZWY2020_053308 [Hordeum vulgare]|nr:hypothetical protein ZWY2020_053308 [Hordeum vulgare]
MVCPRPTRPISFQPLSPTSHCGLAARGLEPRGASAGRLLPSLSSFLPPPPTPVPATPPSSPGRSPRRHDPDDLYSATFPRLTPTTSTSTARPPTLARPRRPRRRRTCPPFPADHTTWPCSDDGATPCSVIGFRFNLADYCNGDFAEDDPYPISQDLSWMMIILLKLCLVSVRPIGKGKVPEVPIHMNNAGEA